LLTISSVVCLFLAIPSPPHGSKPYFREDHFSGGRPLQPGTIVLADWRRRASEARGRRSNIPSMRHRRWKACFSKALYRERNRVERFFNRIKHFRRVATRYEKLSANFLAMLKLAAIKIWLRAYESMA
jgi:hypothetical protein